MSKKIKLFSTTRSMGTVEVNTEQSESREIDLVWTTGFKGLRTTRDGFQYYEELAVSPQAINTSRMIGNPLLANHDTENLDSIIGVIESVNIDPVKKEGRARVRFAKDEYSERVFQKVKDGIIRNTSVGYKIDNFKDVTNKGDEIPTYRAENWTPFEISLCGVGFDPYSNVRSNESTTEVEIESQESNETQITEAVQDSTTVAPQAVDVQQKERTMTEAEKLALELAAKKQAAQEEKQRQNEIRSAVRSAKLEESYADELINQDLSADQARKLVIEKLATQQPTPPKSNVTVEIGADEIDKKRQGAVDAMLARVDSVNFKQKDGNQFNHQSLLRIMESFVGYRPGMSQTELVSRAMSSSDLPYILANVAEKSAQQKYQTQPKTWSRWARKDNLRNFKTHDKVRSGDFSSLEERKEGGEFKRGSFSEEREQVTLKEFGKIMAFTRRMLINDDLSEIQKVIAQGGAAAARLENRLVYEVLSSNPNMGDGTALFHADHDNLGSGAALSDTTIGEAFQLMREQSSVDELEKLNLSPKYLICGPSNEVLARKYLAQISPTQASNVNVFSNSLELIVDSEISTNDYFFAADQNLIPTVTLYHLEGEEQPRIESRTDFETESVEIKVAHSCVAKADDWRGLVKNANAS